MYNIRKKNIIVNSYLQFTDENYASESIRNNMNNQSLKGAVVVTLCQNEADVKLKN